MICGFGFCEKFSLSDSSLQCFSTKYFIICYIINTNIKSSKFFYGLLNCMLDLFRITNIANDWSCLSITSTYQLYRFFCAINQSDIVRWPDIIPFFTHIDNSNECTFTSKCDGGSSANPRTLMTSDIAVR